MNRIQNQQAYQAAGEALFLAEQHPPSEGVFNPVEQTVAGLGEVKMVDAQVISGRQDGWFTIEMDGFTHAVRVTAPIQGQASGVSVVHLPGFTEVIESGPGKAIHDRLAEVMPYVKVVSIASDGVGNLGEKLTLDNMWDHGLEGMAEERIKLIKALCGNGQVVLQGLSMGSVIANIIAELNNRQQELSKLNLLHFDTALVTPENVRAYMLGLFLPSMFSDVPREFVTMCRRYGPVEAMKRLVIRPEHLSGNLLPSVVEGIDLKKGMEFNRIRRVVSAVGATTVSGQFDPLAQFGMWKHLKRSHNDGIHISTVKFRGHGMVADGAAAADKMHSVIQKHRLIDKLVA